MGLYDRDPDEREALILDEARLAAAVIRTALLDALSGCPSELTQDARGFLADQEGALTWWCMVAGLDPEVVKRLVQRTLAEGRGPRRTVGEPWLLSPTASGRPLRRGPLPALQPSQQPF